MIFFLSSPTSDGSGAAVLVSENFLRKHPETQKNAVEILAIEMATDFSSTFDTNDCMRVVKHSICITFDAIYSSSRLVTI